MVLALAVALVAAVAAARPGPDAPGPSALVVGPDTPTTATTGWSTLDRRTGAVLQLAVAPTVVTTFDVDLGRVVGALPLRPAAGDDPFLLERVGAAYVVQSQDGVTRVFDGERPPRRLGRSLRFLPAHPDRVWLVTRGGDGALRVRQVDLAGRHIVPRTPVPAGRTPVAGQGDRVLLDGGGGLRWWYPSTGALRPVPGRRVLAVGETSVVVCDRRCRTVDVLGADGGHVARLRMTERVAAAELSPDGRTIAMLTDSELSTSALAIVDRDTETLRTVTNGVAVDGSARRLTWSRDGTWLFFPTAQGGVGIFNRSDGRIHLLDAEVGAVDAIVAG